MTEAQNFLAYGIAGKLLEQFQVYLFGPTQFVTFGNSTSELTEVTSGVPQGSVLGPLCFLTCINDFESVLQFLCVKLFVDCQQFNPVWFECSSSVVQ